MIHFLVNHYDQHFYILSILAVFNFNGIDNVLVVRWEQDEYGKEAREDIDGNPVGFSREGERLKGNIKEGRRESKTKPSRNKFRLDISLCIIFEIWNCWG